MHYVPRPIDTSRVKVPADIDALAERLARNVHDVWAAERLAAGWRFGPRRDDARKEHPSLVPYDDLSEEEKRYDRQVSMQTLKAVLALGFRITRDPEDHVS